MRRQEIRRLWAATGLLLGMSTLLAWRPGQQARVDLEPVAMKIVAVPDRTDFDRYRKILVSPTVNTPDPFPGFGGYAGWPRVIQLKNGDLLVVFSAGYWHASWVTPLDLPPEMLADIRRDRAWLLEWQAPEGGRLMWIRSRDQGRTWSRPRSFPLVAGAYAPGKVVQMRDGTLITAALIQTGSGHWTRLPTSPMEFAQTVANRFPRYTVFFRSDDQGENWYEVSRVAASAAMGNIEHPHSLFEAPDGALLRLESGSPLPGGPGWPQPSPRLLTALMRSDDLAKTWRVVSVAGSNHFDVDEGSASYLPDGSIGFPSRPTSAWFQSYDDGRTWAAPRLLHVSAEYQENPQFGNEYGGPKLYRRGGVVVTPEGVTVIVFCGGPGGDGQVIYSRDSGKTWVKPAGDRGFKFDPISYYPDATVLEDGSILAVGQHEGLKNQYGPHGAEVSAMRFRIRQAAEGEGIELLPIGEPPPR